MIKNLLKSQIYHRYKEFRSFILLLFLITLTVIVISSYDRFKSEQISNLEKITQNLYLQKTLQSISNSLNPRFEKIEYIIKTGESFE